MAKLIIYKEANPKARELERHLRFAALSPEEKLKELFHLIKMTMALGGKNAYKKPQAKGIVLKRKN